MLTSQPPASRTKEQLNQPVMRNRWPESSLSICAEYFMERVRYYREAERPAPRASDRAIWKWLSRTPKK